MLNLSNDVNALNVMNNHYSLMTHLMPLISEHNGFILVVSKTR